MSKKSSNRSSAQIFNIDREYKKHYPKTNVQTPVLSGVPSYHAVKLHNVIGGESGKCPHSVIYKQAA